MPYIDSSVSGCPALIAFWGLTGLAGLLRPMSLGFVGRTLFPLGALCGVAVAAAAEQAVLRVGVPELPLHRRRAALTRLFQRNAQRASGSKNLVFVGTDAVLHLTVGRNLGRLGVLVQLMLGA